MKTPLVTLLTPLACGLFIAGPLLGETDASRDTAPCATALHAIRNGDIRKLTSLLDDARVADLRDAQGTPLVMYAAFYLNADGLRLFLEKGASPNATNQSGASVLMWAAADADKVRLLLSRGANVNAVSSRGNTALIVAASQHGSAPVLKQLLAAGADVNAHDLEGDSALVAAARSGDLEATRVLIEHKADVNAEATREAVTPEGGSPLMNAAMYGHLDLVKLLLRSGADLNLTGERGNALAWAAFADRRDVAEFLVKRGINVNVGGARLRSFRSDRGYTPLMYAAMTERDNPDLVNLLIKHGADVNAKSEKGESALRFARSRGDTKVVAALLRAGAVDAEPGRPERQKALWREDQIENPDRAVIRKSVESALHLIATSGTNFTEASANRCFSCHQQTLPAVAFGLASQRGFTYERRLVEEQLQDTLQIARRRKDAAIEGPLPVPSIAALLLLGLHASGYESDTLTDGYSYSLARSQFPDGRWIASSARAPMDYTDVTSTVLSMRALQLYSPPLKKNEYAKQVARAASWLRRYRAESTEERAIQLLGLHWSGSGRAEISKLARIVIKHQRPDGGWAQLPTLESDAYATGETLFALRTSGGIESNDPVYRRGMKFLLATQCEDGSWFVPTRAFPVQRAMDGIFSHGNDQWISSVATTWASMALMAGQDETTSRVAAALNSDR